MKQFAKRLLILVAAGSFFLLAFGASSAFAKPCWQTLIDDWYDGRIDGVYSVKCYREARKHAPEDLVGYSDLPSDLDRALQSLPIKRGPNGELYVTPGGSGHGKKRSTQGRGKSNDPATPSIGSRDPPGPIQRALRETGGSSTSIPIPLLALGGLALLLTASGATGLVARRVRARRSAGEPPAPDA